jgi:tetratricopeptide (TPR) repeat protein
VKTATRLRHPRIRNTDYEALARGAGDPGRLIGYRTERRSLLRWLGRVGPLATPSLLILGPSGSGKTRLAQVALSHARRQGGVACRGACELTQGPFSPLVEALRGVVEGTAPPEVRRQLSSCLARRSDLTELVGIYADPVSRLTPEEVGRTSIFQALAQACFALSASGPALLVVEDCQWADDLTLEFLRYLVTRARVHSLKILLTCRNEPSGEIPARVLDLADALHKTDGLLRMALGGVSTAETDSLIRSIYPKNSFSQKLKSGVVQATSGNPTAILSALHLFESEGVIYREGDTWRERRSPRGQTAPGELYDSLVERLERLSPDVVRVLRLAALSGNSAEKDLLQQASGLPRVRFMRAVGVLTRIHGVLHQIDEHCEFTSDQVAQTVRRRIGSAAPALHACLADAIETIRQEGSAKWTEALAEHRLKAGDVERALPSLMEAGEHCARFGSHDRALHFYERAVEEIQKLGTPSGALGTRMRVLRKVAESRAALKAWSASEEAYRELIDLARNGRNRMAEGKALEGLGRNCARRKEYGQALKHYELALQLFLEQDDALDQCTVLSDMGSVYLELGKWQDLERTYVSAIAIARDRGYTTQIAGMAMNRAIMFAMKGRHDKAAQAFGQCLSLNQRLGRNEAAISCLINLGKCAADSGDTRTAKHNYLLALRQSRRRYDTQREAIARLNLSEVFLLENRPDLCQRCCEEALRQFEEIGHRVGIADANRILGCAAQQRGDHYTAFTCLEKSISCNRQTGYRLGEAESLRDYGRFLVLADQESGSGREHLAEAHTIFSELGISREVEAIDDLLGTTKREPAPSERDGGSGPPPVQEPVPSGVI